MSALGARSRRPSNLSMHMGGLALAATSGGMGTAGLLALVRGEPEAGALLVSTLLGAAAGLLLWRGTRAPVEMGVASVLAAVAWTWVIVSVGGALPYLLSGVLERPDDALFEAVAGFTTTGHTVITDLEEVGRGLLLWRSLTQWYGGMGVVVLALAVLPLLGVGGFELLRAETPGPTAQRLAPRVSETAKRLWAVYLGLTAAVALALVAVGMGLYDAVSHAMTALSTGGYSPYEDSIAHFDSLAVELVLVVAMVAGGVNFVLHWRALRGDPGAYWRMPELRFFLGALAVGTVLATAFKVIDGAAVAGAAREALFTVVSIGSNTAFSTTDHAAWAPAAQLVLVFFMVAGAMASSTSGGVKILRVQVLAKVARREVTRARHPRAVRPVMLGRDVVDEQTVARIAGFGLCWVVIWALASLLLAALGSGLVEAGSGSVAAITNVGVGLGDIGPESSALYFDRPSRAILAVLMIVGRLEIFPVLLMFAAAGRWLDRRRGLRVVPR